MIRLSQRFLLTFYNALIQNDVYAISSIKNGLLESKSFLSKNLKNINYRNLTHMNKYQFSVVKDFQCSLTVQMEVNKLSEQIGQNYGLAMSSLVNQMKVQMQLNNPNKLIQVLDKTIRYIQKNNLNQYVQVENIIGMKYFQLKSYDKSIYVFEKLMPRFQKMYGKYHIQIAAAQFHISKCYGLLNLPDIQQQHLLKCYEIMKKVGDVNEAYYINQVGLFYLNVRQNKQVAQKYFQQALQSFKKHNYSFKIVYIDIFANYINSITLTKENAELICQKYESTVSMYKNWLKTDNLKENQKKQIETAIQFMNKPIGLCKYTLQRYTEARKHLQKANTSFQNIKVFDFQTINTIYNCLSSENLSQQGEQFFSKMMNFAHTQINFKGFQDFVLFCERFSSILALNGKVFKVVQFSNKVKQILKHKQKPNQNNWENELKLHNIILELLWRSGQPNQALQTVRFIQKMIKQNQQQIQYSLRASTQLNCLAFELLSLKKLQTPKQKLQPLIVNAQKIINGFIDNNRDRQYMIKLIITLESIYDYSDKIQKISTGINLQKLVKLLQNSQYSFDDKIKCLKQMCLVYKTGKHSNDITYKLNRTIGMKISHDLIQQLPQNIKKTEHIIKLSMEIKFLFLSSYTIYFANLLQFLHPSIPMQELRNFSQIVKLQKNKVDGVITNFELFLEDKPKTSQFDQKRKFIDDIKSEIQKKWQQKIDEEMIK